jgi:glycosyltransferase involved in cell wall biosynthesis
MPEIFASDYPEWIASRGYRRFRWLSRHRVTKFLAISHSTAADYQRLWKIPKTKIGTVHIGVSGFPPVGHHSNWLATLISRFPHLAGRRFLLAPYNLEPRKNLVSMLEAFSLVRRQSADLLLVLFGKSAWTINREKKTFALIESLGIGDAVRLTGFIDDLSLAALYRASELFVFPSLYEGFGLPVLEAMACGACVVARDISAMAEVAGDASFLVDTSDKWLLAEGISSLMANPIRREELRSKAMARAAQFTVERMASETVSLYRSVLSECLG